MKEPVYAAAGNRYDCGMQYRRAGKSGILLPAVSLGLWHNFGDVDTLSLSQKKIHYAFDHGVTHFDLANNYGPSYGSAEETFGSIMQRSMAPYRDELFISTKAGHDMWEGPYGIWNSRKHLMASLDQSLKRMRLDYVDIFYSHRYDPETPLAQGLLSDRYLNGIPEDSRIARGGYLKKEALTDKVLSQIKALNQVALRRNQTLAEMSLAWLLQDNRVTSVIIGASSVEQLKDNLNALSNTNFAPEELQEIRQITELQE